VKDAHLQGKVTRALENSFEETACKLRLYLLTPALFEHEQGWIPDFICPATLKGERDGIQYELIAAALPRAIAVSGWDMVKRQPRLGRRLVPAGSVYFLKARSDTLTKEQFVQALLDSHWFKSIVSGEDERKMGFGVTLIGGFDYAD
jgi:CRISPR/Cas system CMR-associated protein Cmr3 (group 5 of RAMP superfamily)